MSCRTQRRISDTPSASSVIGYGAGAKPVHCAIESMSAGEVMLQVSETDRGPGTIQTRIQQAALRLVVAIARAATELLVRVDR